MATPRATRWPIEPHTQIKHLILRRYLQAWLPMMAKYNGRILFVDGFAGPGRYSGGDEGSPLIALRAVLDHPHFRKPQHQREVVFFFIESRQDRAAALAEELKKLTEVRPMPSWIKFHVLEGEFAPLMTEALEHVQREGRRLAPTFAFIDPFGFAGVPMEVICRIVRNPRCECLITFMYESINRFVGHPDPSIQSHFDELFDTEDWRVLLGEQDPDSRRDQIVGLYRRQLIEKAHLRYVRTFEMINQGNRTEYFLYFGTNSPEGLGKMKQAMWKADPLSGQVFSDRSDPAQAVLLQVGGEAGLRQLLQRRFSDRGFTRIEEIEQFVLEDTPYSEAIHLKRKTLGQMEQETPPAILVRRPAGVRNRAGDYPPGTLVKFP